MRPRITRQLARVLYREKSRLAECVDRDSGSHLWTIRQRTGRAPVGRPGADHRFRPVHRTTMRSRRRLISISCARRHPPRADRLDRPRRPRAACPAWSRSSPARIWPSQGVKPMKTVTPFKRPDCSPTAVPPRRCWRSRPCASSSEAVVAVVADTLAQARDAADAIEIEYDPLAGRGRAGRRAR